MLNRLKSIKAFTLIELIVVMVILAVLAAILVPIINNFLETAKQATDNANARLIYNASAMWFSENNKADADLDATKVVKYLGSTTYPMAGSVAFGGSFHVTVTAGGVITVTTTKPATYDSSSGKLVP